MSFDPSKTRLQTLELTTEGEPLDEFDAWYEGVQQAWNENAPSYVRHEITPASGPVREFYNAGVTTEQFREALEVAFTQDGVTRRNALRYSYGILRRQAGI